MPDLTYVTEILPNLGDILVYAAIAVVTLIGIVKCLVPLWNTTHALRRAIRRLQQDAGNNRDKPVWQEGRFMGRRLKCYWLRFLQNAEQLDRRGLPCNVEDYINDDTVTHGPGNATLAELIPSLLTSLGILGTFMGMMRGLSGLDFSNASNIIAGIPTLLSGMQFAFGTSVAGVSCSIVFNMLNRIAQGSSYRTVDEFVTAFTQLAMQRPLDNDVQLICQNQDSNHMLSTLTETLPGQLAGTIELSMSRALQPVAQSMDNFLIGATRAQVDGVNRIVTNFVGQMNATLNDQFLALGRTLTDINQHQQLSADQVNQSLAAASSLLQETDRLHHVSQDVMAHFEAYVRAMSESRRRDEQFEHSSADLLNKMTQAGDHQAALLARMQSGQEELNNALEQFRQQSRDALNGMRQMNNDSADRLTAISQTMQGSSKELSQSYQTFVQNVIGGVSQALGMFDENMNSLIATLTDKVASAKGAGTSGVTAAQMSEVQQTLAAIQESIQRAADSLASQHPKEG